MSDNGIDETLRTKKWTRSFENPVFDERDIHALEFEEVIKTIKCNKVTFEFFNMNAAEFDCAWGFC